MAELVSFYRVTDEEEAILLAAVDRAAYKGVEAVGSKTAHVFAVTKKTEKAVADYKKGTALLGLTQLKEGLLALGIGFGTLGTPAAATKGRRGRPPGSGKKAAAAPVGKPGRKTRKPRARLADDHKKWIAAEAVKGGSSASIFKAFVEKFGFAPSYQTVNNYAKAAKPQKPAAAKPKATKPKAKAKS